MQITGHFLEIPMVISALLYFHELPIAEHLFTDLAYFVPDSFGNGVIIPLVKDMQGDLCNIDNYCGINLSPFFAKLFEHCILDKYDYLMSSNYLQFGFKKHSSCSHAIFVLRLVAEFFMTHGSNGSAGCKKGFSSCASFKTI